MSFKAVLKVTLRREFVTPPEDDDERPDFEKQNTQGIYEANVSVRNGVVNIDYTEPGGTKCRISFPKAEPEIVTLSQNFPFGNDRIVLVLEAGVRHISINNYDGDNMEITTDCRHLSNTVLKDGKMRLSYNVELHGFRVEKVSMKLELKKLN